MVFKHAMLIDLLTKRFYYFCIVVNDYPIVGVSNV